VEPQGRDAVVPGGWAVTFVQKSVAGTALAFGLSGLVVGPHDLVMVGVFALLIGLGGLMFSNR
jgi:hypothetical protein